VVQGEVHFENDGARGVRGAEELAGEVPAREPELCLCRRRCCAPTGWHGERAKCPIAASAAILAVVALGDCQQHTFRIT